MPRLGVEPATLRIWVKYVQRGGVYRAGLAQTDQLAEADPFLGRASAGRSGRNLDPTILKHDFRDRATKCLGSHGGDQFTQLQCRLHDCVPRHEQLSGSKGPTRRRRECGVADVDADPLERHPEDLRRDLAQTGRLPPADIAYPGI